MVIATAAVQLANSLHARASADARALLTRTIQVFPISRKTDPYLRSLYQNAARRVSDSIGIPAAKLWSVTASRL